MGNCLSLCARGWGIDHQERKNLQILRNVPGGGGTAIGQIELSINRERRKGVAVKQITQLTQISR